MGDLTRWWWWWWWHWWPVVLVVLVVHATSPSTLPPVDFPSPSPVSFAAPPGTECTFESSCPWEWKDKAGFELTTGLNVSEKFHSLSPGSVTGPFKDSKGKPAGHFLYMVGRDKTQVANLTSPWFQSSGSNCHLEIMMHMNMEDAKLKLVVQTKNVTWVAIERPGNHKSMWENQVQNIGKVDQPFRIILEVEQSTGKIPTHLALDNIQMVQCFPELPPRNECTQREFRCNNDLCINWSRVCDITEDCLDGEDERQKCDLMPQNSSCTFEDGWCGWKNDKNGTVKWIRHNGSTPTDVTGPSVDHTYRNSTGMYLYLRMRASGQFSESGILNSQVFPPPPCYHRNNQSLYYGSCQIRFNFHQFGPHAGVIELYVREILPNRRGIRKRMIFRSVGDKKDLWHHQVVPIPDSVMYRYYFQFEGIRGIRHYGDLALDDISLNPKCFGIGIPPNESDSCSASSLTPTCDNYTCNPPTFDPLNFTKYMLGTCGAKGRIGPTPSQCAQTYHDTNTNVTVLTKQKKAGMQVWTVPESGFYTLIAKGASGGKGVKSFLEKSKGAVARTVLEMHAGEKFHVVVGQEGISACQDPNRDLDAICRDGINSMRGRGYADKRRTGDHIIGGGGGGGGATYIYKVYPEGTTVPILVAAGGGGFSYNLVADSSGAYGKGANSSAEGISGTSLPKGAGSGGGWLSTNQSESPNGASLLDGSVGGAPCAGASVWGTEGGFGGGGGACTAGGGAGGYVGGNAYTGSSSNGEGGMSYLSGMLASVEEGAHVGPGEVLFILAMEGCGCNFQCVVLDETRHETRCLCPAEWVLADDGVTCKAFAAEPEEPFEMPYLVALVVSALLLSVLVGMLCMFLYNRYQKQKIALLRRKMLNGPDLQLNRLRTASGGMVTEYNPNYEFGGGTYTIHDLKEIPRENLRLVKALGQGAFGEVYQGFFRHRAGDAVEMPVAVKTLPELSSNQAEMDFLMEALIMSKFSHPNIVHFIGVCFDKHPRFIVLELLAGGDLKTFLRDSRPKPDRPSPLTMKDLLICSMDVAKGCKYLEENHFIHRDIAARNCLLTTKGPGRVVKIADFGMARDIYRADYYRKGGKAMLPVKWMPPEAFLDGIFTSKTDVWSFGVLLWEVMSLGYMPYPGRGNQEVMQLVTNGGRLEPPSNCPGPVYGIMTQCWHPIPDERPYFSTVIERIGYCMQDPEVINSPLPVFHRPPSSERDATIMRPSSDSDNSCLRVHRRGLAGMGIVMGSFTEPQSPASADYLVPIPSSNYSISTQQTELQASPSANSIDRLLELADAEDDDLGDYGEEDDLRRALSDDARPAKKQWETSFAVPEPSSCSPSRRRSGGYTSIPRGSEATNGIPESQSSQPLLQDSPTDSPSKMAAAASGVVNMAVNPSPPPLQSYTSNRDCVLQPPTTPAPPPPGPVPKSSLQASVALDAAALCKQHQHQPMPYVNVSVKSQANNSRRAPGDQPFTLQAPRATSLPDGEIAC